MVRQQGIFTLHVARDLTDTSCGVGNLEWTRWAGSMQSISAGWGPFLCWWLYVCWRRDFHFGSWFLVWLWGYANLGVCGEHHCCSCRHVEQDLEEIQQCKKYKGKGAHQFLIVPSSAWALKRWPPAQHSQLALGRGGCSQRALCAVPRTGGIK